MREKNIKIKKKMSFSTNSGLPYTVITQLCTMHSNFYEPQIRRKKILFKTDAFKKKQKKKTNKKKQSDTLEAKS